MGGVGTWPLLHLPSSLLLPPASPSFSGPCPRGRMGPRSWQRSPCRCPAPPRAISHLFSPCQLGKRVGSSGYPLRDLGQFSLFAFCTLIPYLGSLCHMLSRMEPVPHRGNCGELATLPFSANQYDTLPECIIFFHIKNSFIVSNYTNNMCT